MALWDRRLDGTTLLTYPPPPSVASVSKRKHGRSRQAIEARSHQSLDGDRSVALVVAAATAECECCMIEEEESLFAETMTNAMKMKDRRRRGDDDDDAGNIVDDNDQDGRP